jgi:hypothetical protein
MRLEVLDILCSYLSHRMFFWGLTPKWKVEKDFHLNDRYSLWLHLESSDKVQILQTLSA